MAPVVFKVKKQPIAVKGENSPAAPRKAPLSGYELHREMKQNQANVRDMGARAICRIKKAIREGAQGDGQAFIPEDWEDFFKATLGSYKKFLLSRPDQFRLVDGEQPGKYTIEPILQEVVQAPSWEDIAASKGKGKWKGKGKGKPGKDGSMPAPFPQPKGKGKEGKGKETKGKSKGKAIDPAKGMAAAGKQAPVNFKVVTPHAQRVLAGKAVDEIKTALLRPQAQRDGKPFMPPGWNSRFAPSLGPYMDFLLSRPDQFCLIESGAGRYTIQVVGEQGRPLEPATKAVRQLAQAAQDELEAPEEDDDDDVGDGEEGEAGFAQEDEEMAEEEPVDETAFEEALAEDDEPFAEDEDPPAEEDADEEIGDDESAFPVQQPSKHGSFIRSMLGGGILGSLG